MLRYYVIIVFLLLANGLFAQHIVVKVAVDSSHSALSIPISVNGQVRAMTNIHGECLLADIRENDLIEIRTLAFEPYSYTAKLAGRGDSLFVKLASRVYVLDEIQVSPISAGELMEKALATQSQGEFSASMLLRQYLGNGNQYERLSEAFGTLYLPAAEPGANKLVTRSIYAKKIQLPIQQYCLMGEDKRGVIYDFNPFNLASRSLTTASVFYHYADNENYDTYVQQDETYYIVTISKRTDAESRLREAVWHIGKVAFDLVQFYEWNEDASKGTVDRYFFEYKSIQGQTVPASMRHEQELKQDDATYYGGQEIFTLLEGEPYTDKGRNVNRYIPDLKHVSTRRRDCESVNRFKKKHAVADVHVRKPDADLL